MGNFEMNYCTLLLIRLNPMIWNLHIAFWKMGVFCIRMRAGMDYCSIIIRMKISKKRFAVMKFLGWRRMDGAIGIW